MSEVEKLKKMIDDHSTALPDTVRKSFDKHVGEIEKHMAPRLPRKPRDPNVPTQFEIKKNVKDTMADFAGWERGSAHSRIDITNAIHKYIKEKDLQIPACRREFRIDTPLKKLLDCDEPTLSYPKLQKYISRQFV